MTHLWVRAETRANERRVGLTPDGVRRLIADGFGVTVEDSADRIIPAQAYRDAGATITPAGSWREAPPDAIIFGLKELPADGSKLVHRHIMFGHAFKGQDDGPDLLRRFREGGGALYDLEYLTDEDGRRLAAFGYWAGYTGAAVSLRAWAAQQRGAVCAPVHAYADRHALTAELRADLDSVAAPRPSTIIVGAKGRVGRGAHDLLTEMGGHVTGWDLDETRHGGPFPEITQHPIFINAILAQPGCPVLLPRAALGPSRLLRVVGDVACDPTSEFNPVPVYDRATGWDAPVIRVEDDPPLDVMAIDNLPSILPLESSQDFAAQLLPVLAGLDRIDSGAWGRARAIFDSHVQEA
ncbi:saccharopine dehydrogenase (NAD+, L-lysine forming) [Paracoccus isoporae]|uniref:Saccharopine dehydrogenase [NAD(+), L-lysine-forming] n=1 Tax=Paracoccus isoporae TaxID=591205 RepID=A0A1G6UVY1_9RHOB|nr:saccharopine dehydrogenase [Paracoccus isoporae]SDD44725.1 saccharopine dehydrogenase (NAD+, L-lysine forming) [Paracoccus isoporae]